MITLMGLSGVALALAWFAGMVHLLRTRDEETPTGPVVACLIVAAGLVVAVASLIAHINGVG